MERAIAALEACPEIHRNWEWRYVARLCRLEKYAVKPTTAGAGVNRLPVLFMPDGKSWVVGAAIGDSSNRLSVVQLWDTASGRWLENLASEPLPGVASLAASPDGRLLAVGFQGDRPIEIRQVPGGRLMQELFPARASGQVSDMAFSTDGRRLVDARNSGKVVLWDLASAKPLRVLDAHPADVNAVAFHPDGRLVASGGADGLIRLWHSDSGAAVRTIKAHDGAIFDLSFSSDRKRLASGGWDRILRIWDVATGALAIAIPCESGFISRTEFLVGGDRIAASNGGLMTIWNASSGRPLLKLNGWNQIEGGVDISRDGAAMLTTAGDGSVRLWETATAAPRILQTTDWVNDVAVSPDGATVAAAGAGLGQYLERRHWAGPPHTERPCRAGAIGLLHGGWLVAAHYIVGRLRGHLGSQERARAQDAGLEVRTREFTKSGRARYQDIQCD